MEDVETGGGGEGIEIDFPENVQDLENDDEYDGECGYWLVKMLRGTTTGRMLKRDIFKTGLTSFTAGMVLLIITVHEQYNFGYSSYFDTVQAGLSLMQLMWLVSLPSVLFGVMSFVIVKFWASLVTNRNIVILIMRVYMVIVFCLIGVICWCIAGLLITFKGVKWLNETGILKEIFPCYISTMFFIFPYGFAMVLYLLDIHYLTEEVEYEGEIREPPSSLRNQSSFDMSSVNTMQACGFVIAVPLLILYQVWDAVIHVLKLIYSTCSVYYNMHVRRSEERKKRKGVITRLCRTIMRMIREFCASFRKKPDIVAPAPEMSAELKRLKEKMDMEDDLEREKLRARIAEEMDEARIQREEEEAKRKKEEEEKALREAAEAKAALDAANTMSVAVYKELWGKLSIAGSFQCKLKMGPTLASLTEHFKKQGFHVVFASSPNSIDVEVGISNIRDDKQRKWFMARFLASATSFSAVMKSEDTDLVTGFVKKFALAKALKIDTSNK